MPSPFPGMDPYLEGEEWVSFHAQFAVEIARQLSPRLRPRYVARAGRHYVFDFPDSSSEITISAPHHEPHSRPDVSVVEVGKSNHRGAGNGGAVAVAPLQLATPILEPFPTYKVKVEDVDERNLVTAIEVLSPANKRGGRKEYLKKRRRILAGSTHLIEIDLTRRGRRVPMMDPLPPAPYFVLLSRIQRRPIMDVWAITLRDPLPSVPVPLMYGDADVELSLAEAFTAVYDIFNYDLTLDYSKPPEGPLSPEEAAWAEQLLRERGLR